METLQSLVMALTGGISVITIIAYLFWSYTGNLTFMLIDFTYGQLKATKTKPSWKYYRQRNKMRMLCSFVIIPAFIILGSSLFEYVTGVKMEIANWSAYLIGLFADGLVKLIIKMVRKFAKKSN